jgi:hypothetical protein
MKAVIAVSGLAGFLLFGPNLSHLIRDAIRPQVPVRPPEVVHVVRNVQTSCRYEAQRSLSIPAESGDLLRLVAGSGSLEVVGVAGLREVRATARACASHEELLEDLRLDGGRNGATVRVETLYPDARDRGGWGSRYARLDLRLEVPEGMRGEIRDSSGEMTVSGTGDLDIDDSSGEIHAHDILGSLRIDDSSGEIVLRDVTGDVEIDDGSGEIDVSGIGGSLTVRDGSGEIDAGDIQGTVRVVRDGSGSIQVNGVGGDFVVERDGSGGIDFRNVTGRVDVPRKGR